ncbi:MAG: hemolysin family protein [Nitriliruptoraceae bacterium]
MNDVGVLAVVIIVLVALSAFLAAVETVVTRVHLVRALRLDDEQRRGSASLLWLIEHRVTALNALLVATVLSRIAVTAVAIALALRVNDGALTIGAALLIVAVASLVLGEVVPRTLALRALEATGLRLAAPARVLVRVLSPLATFVVSLGRALVPRRLDAAGPYVSDDEEHEAEVDDDESDDELEPEERAMIQSIFDLADTRVREIMTPRPDMVTIAEDARFDAVVDVVNERGYSRLPVHAADDPDTFVGVVYAKDLLARVTSGDRLGWEDLVRPATFVPETKHGDDLLRDLQASAVHMAIVVDEYGDIVGLVTIEDILEEIVGEIVDEHDHEEPLVEVLDDGEFRIDARLGVDDLNDLLDAELPEEGWDTLGGLVFGTLGRVAAEGETIELNGITLTVESVQGRRVGKVRVTRHDDDGEDADDSAESASSPTS